MKTKIACFWITLLVTFLVISAALPNTALAHEEPHRVFISWQPTSWFYNHWVIQNGQPVFRSDTGYINPLFEYDWVPIMNHVQEFWQRYVPDFYLSGWRLESPVTVVNDESAPWNYRPPPYQRNENRLYISAVPYDGIWGYAAGGTSNGEITVVSQLFGQGPQSVLSPASDVEIFLAHEIGHMLNIGWHCESRRDCIMRPGGPVGYSALPGNVVYTLQDAILCDDCLARLMSQ